MTWRTKYLVPYQEEEEWEEEEEVQGGIAREGEDSCQDQRVEQRGKDTGNQVAQEKNGHSNKEVRRGRRGKRPVRRF